MRSLSEETSAKIYQEHYRKGYDELQQNLDFMFTRNYEPTRENLNSFATMQYREVTAEHERAANGMWMTTNAQPAWLDGAHQAIIDYHAGKVQQLGKETPQIEQEFAVSV